MTTKKNAPKVINGTKLEKLLDDYVQIKDKVHDVFHSPDSPDDLCYFAADTFCQFYKKVKETAPDKLDLLTPGGTLDKITEEDADRPMTEVLADIVSDSVDNLINKSKAKIEGIDLGEGIDLDHAIYTCKIDDESASLQFIAYDDDKNPVLEADLACLDYDEEEELAIVYLDVYSSLSTAKTGHILDLSVRDMLAKDIRENWGNDVKVKLKVKFVADHIYEDGHLRWNE